MTLSDVDLLSIDATIRKAFDEQYCQLPGLYERLKDLETTALSANLSTRMKHDLEKTLEKTREHIKKLESKEDLNFYTAETAEIINEYMRILKTPIKLSFTGKVKTDDKVKASLVQRYLDIAQKYHKIEVKSTPKKHHMSCEGCSNKKDFIIEDNSCICPECGTQQELVSQSTSYKDVDRVNIATKYTYDRKIHFRDGMNQYQGKQNCTIDQKVYDDLEEIMERHHLLVGDKTTKKTTRFSRIAKEHTLMFLRELGYPKHYENLNLIHYNLTGVKPDDISHLEDVLLADFDLLVETYDKHFKHKVSRVNFISTQYVLFQLLQRHKHPCKKEDFVILKTMERKSFHDTLCQELFSRLGWNFVSLY